MIHSPNNPDVQQLIDFIQSRICDRLQLDANRRLEVERYMKAESQVKMSFELVEGTSHYTSDSKFHICIFLSNHLLRRKDKLEHANWVEHVENRLLFRLDRRLSMRKRDVDDVDEIGEVYFLEEVVSILKQWIDAQKAIAENPVSLREFSEAGGHDLKDLDEL